MRLLIEISIWKCQKHLLMLNQFYINRCFRIHKIISVTSFGISVITNTKVRAWIYCILHWNFTKLRKLTFLKLILKNKEYFWATFEVSQLSWGSWSRRKNFLKPKTKPQNQVSLVQIIDIHIYMLLYRIWTLRTFNGVGQLPVFL